MARLQEGIAYFLRFIQCTPCPKQVSMSQRDEGITDGESLVHLMYSFNIFNSVDDKKWMDKLIRYIK